MRRWLILLALLSILSSCGLLPAGSSQKELVEKATIEFYERYDQRDFVELYHRSDPAFKAAAREEDMTGLLKIMAEVLGKREKSQQTDYEISTSDEAGTVATVYYTSTYTGGITDERIQIRLVEGLARLLNFRVEPRDEEVRCRMRLSVCGQNTSQLGGRPAVELATARFWQLVSTRQYEVIYTEADPLFRKAAALEKLTTFLDEMRVNAGERVSGRVREYSVANIEGSLVATIVYESVYASGEATERFQYRLGAMSRLVQYHFEPR